MPRAVVVGAGIMGTNHARLTAQLPEWELVAIVDPDAERAGPLAAHHGVVAVPDLSSVPLEYDAAVVAAPTPLHLDLVLWLLEQGRHVLVEKPMAASVEEARRMAKAADASGRVLMVGHIERFNPAVLELPNLVDRPLHVVATRVSPYSARIGDDVVLDLMIHDLDIILSLAASPVRRVKAVGQIMRSPTTDLATALLEFESGLTATVTASRVGQHKVRELVITQPEDVVTVDLLRQDVTVNRVAHVEYTSTGGTRYRQTGVVEIPFLEHRGEPLALELQEFARAIDAGRAPRVPAADGVAALELAELIMADIAGG
jgi:predicted dehydrogenase